MQILNKSRGRRILFMTVFYTSVSCFKWEWCVLCAAAIVSNTSRHTITVLSTLLLFAMILFSRGHLPSQSLSQKVSPMVQVHRHR